MQLFTVDQIKKLSAYESYFESAVVANYVRNIPSDKLSKIIEIWKEASGENVKTITCGVCQLNFFKKVGKKYFEGKEYYSSEKYKDMMNYFQNAILSQEVIDNELRTLENETKEPELTEQTGRDSTSTRKAQGNARNKRKGK